MQQQKFLNVIIKTQIVNKCKMLNSARKNHDNFVLQPLRALSGRFSWQQMISSHIKFINNIE